MAGGRVVIGGSPLRLWRLTAAGADVLGRALAGQDVAFTPTRGHLLERMVDAGALHPEPAPGPFTRRDVTVVVPVRDRADSLERLLRSLGEVPDVDRPNSVVVVDDGSHDEPAHARVAATHGATLVRRDRPGGPGAARNDGVARVAGALVAVLDSDCVVSAGWLEPLLGHLGDDRVAAVAPRVRASTGPSPGTLARYDAIRSPLDLGPRPGRVEAGTRLSYVPSAGVVFRRVAFDAVGGFDPLLRFGDDVDLVWRLVEAGWRVRYEPSSEVFHDVRSGRGPWLRQRFDYGTSAAALDQRHRGRLAPLSCSPWSAAGWATVAAGRPALGVAVLAGSAAALPPRLGGVPARESLRLAVLGHLGAGRQLARAVVRVWWPLALLACLVSRRARRVVGACAVVVVVDARAAGGDRPLDRVRFAALTLVDDATYGAGVWAGCLRRRSIGALLPRLVRWPARSAP